jgi:glutamate-1-semialdehyde 2,1-aminomutase
MVQVALDINGGVGTWQRTAATVAPPEARAQDVLVGGSNSAFPLPLDACLERGSGCRVWDEDGREYVDFLLASGPLILGHAHPRVCEAVSRQLAKGSTFCATSRPIVELAERVAQIPGCVETIRFASTGTEATLHAVRLARAYTGRDKVLVFAGSYHGSHEVSLVGHRGAARAQRGGIPRSVIEDTAVAQFNDIASVEEAFALHGPSLAAVLIEPQQRSVDPVPGFLERLAEMCRAEGTVLIFDEVMTGFRLAFGGAQEYYGVQPDLVCYGKILGGGFPLSAVGGRGEIMGLMDPARASSSSFVHVSGTLSGNPISAVAGLATLDELEQPGTYEQLHELGRRLRTGLAGEISKHGLAGSVTGSGPIAAVEFSDLGEPGTGRVLKAAVNRELIRRQVLAQLQTRFYVSTVHTEEDVDFAIDAFSSAMVAAVESVSAGGKALAV